MRLGKDLRVDVQGLEDVCCLSEESFKVRVVELFSEADVGLGEETRVPGIEMASLEDVENLGVETAVLMLETDDFIIETGNLVVEIADLLVETDLGLESDAPRLCRGVDPVDLTVENVGADNFKCGVLFNWAFTGDLITVGLAEFDFFRTRIFRFEAKTLVSQMAVLLLPVVLLLLPVVLLLLSVVLLLEIVLF